MSRLPKLGGDTSAELLAVINRTDGPGWSLIECRQAHEPGAHIVIAERRRRAEVGPKAIMVERFGTWKVDESGVHDPRYFDDRADADLDFAVRVWTRSSMAADPKKALSAFLRVHVTPLLSARGYRRRGQRYSALQEGNVVFVQFQRRADFFTCDLGFINATLRAAGFMSPAEHWAVRLGPVAVGYDNWWDLASESPGLAADFLASLELGLAHIEPLASDEGFRARLLGDAASGELRPFEAGWLVTLQRVTTPIPGNRSRVPATSCGSSSSIAPRVNGWQPASPRR